MLLAAATAIAATGCGSSSGAKASSVSLNPAVATAYVDAQARALCLVQSKAYPTQAALEAAYVRAEHSANLSATELARSQVAVAHDVALRARISNQVMATCGTRNTSASTGK